MARWNARGAKTSKKAIFPLLSPPGLSRLCVAVAWVWGSGLGSKLALPNWDTDSARVRSHLEG